MKKLLCLTMAWMLCLLCACGSATSGASTPTEFTTEPTEAVTQPTQAATAPTEPVTEPTEPVTEPTVPEDHRIPVIPGIGTEDMIGYFNEVCLDAEFENAGDSSLLQKWAEPIYYVIHGEPTEADLEILDRLCRELNGIYGFPGIFPAPENMPQLLNLNIHFCTEDEMLDILGQNFAGCDGGVTFWYNGINEINDAIICYRTDIDQEVRNSVIQEEIYNGLGPVQDTWLRDNSLIYAGYSTPQQMTDVDKVILQLLYHPDMLCGMNADACTQVIRELYQEEGNNYA